MPVTPHQKSGHNPPTPHDATPPRHPPAHCPTPPGHNSPQSSTPPSQPSGQCQQPQLASGQTNRSRPSTTHQLPQCRHKTCSNSPAPKRTTVAWCSGRAITAPKLRSFPSMPAPYTPTLPHGIPRHTKQTSRPAPPPKRNHIPINAAHCPAKNPRRSPARPPPSQRTEHRSQGPRSKEIQAILRDPKRQSTPKTRNHNHSPDHDQKAHSLSRPPTPDNKLL
ncbi:hypothetical protein CRENBAI_017206 [Crenichthys baileyi]|uniref:Uncharacterized protein n=1 Tax=Crenichthys baileyi TaxID=28760 RepID=A0AAV9RD92_9TELE